MAEITTLLGYILAALMAILAFICWRKAMSLYTLLVESVNRFENLKQHAAKVDKENAKLVERSESHKEANQRLEKQLNAGKSKVDADIKRLEARALNAEEQRAQLELRLDHLRPQVDALTRQLQESEQALKEAQTKLSYTSNAADKRITAARHELESQLEETRKKHREIEQKLQQNEGDLLRARKAAGDIDPEKIKDLVRKASHFENLYRSMRGLREMADERNKNWEVALRKLSEWILKNHEPAMNAKSMALGPTVGAALEVIGERLVQDEFSDRAPSSFASTEVLSKPLDLNP